MNWADWAIIAILVLSALISIKRGFVREALSLATWVAAVLVAVLFSEPLSYLLHDHIATPSVREMVAFAILFIATLLAGGLIGYVMGALIQVTGLSGTDRLLGMLFGLARGIIVIMVCLIFLPGLLSVNQDPWWQESALIPHFLEFETQARDLFSQVVSFFTGFFSQESP